MCWESRQQVFFEFIWNMNFRRFHFAFSFQYHWGQSDTDESFIRRQSFGEQRNTEEVDSKWRQGLSFSDSLCPDRGRLSTCTSHYFTSSPLIFRPLNPREVKASYQYSHLICQKYYWLDSIHATLTLIICRTYLPIILIGSGIAWWWQMDSKFQRFITLRESQTERERGVEKWWANL